MMFNNSLVGFNKRISNKNLGDYGEKLAVKFLKKHHYKILERNYAVNYGEIDIIAQDGDYLVFIEVKYRSNKLYGLPSEAVNFYKQRKIRSVALNYVVSHNIMSPLIRFDVVTIIDKEIRLLKSAFY